MAMTYLGEQFGSRSAEGTSDGARTYRQIHLVRATAGEPETEVTAVAGVPQYGDLYAYDLSASMRKFAPRYLEGGIWEIEVEFERRPGDQQQRDPNPLTRRPEVEWDSRPMLLSVSHDRASPPLPYVNSAGGPFKEVPQTEIFPSILVFQRNETTFSAADQRYYLGAVNSDSFLGAAAKSVKCTMYKGVYKYEEVNGGEIGYWSVTRHFEYCELPWNPLKVLDAGYNYFDGATWVEGDVEVNLNGSGAKVTDGDPPAYLSFTQCREVSFASLNVWVPQ